MKIVKCDACGGNEFKRVGGVYECLFCGSRYTLDGSGNVLGKELTEARIISLLENSKKLHAENKFAEELEVLIKALEMDENNTQTMVKLGRCYRCLDLPDKAIQCYERTLELDPGEGTAYTNMGTIYILRQDYEEAAKCYEKGMPLLDRAKFDYWIAYANYAVAVARLGDPEKAEKMIKEAEANGYENGKTLREMAGIQKKSFVSKLRSLFSDL